MGKVLLLDAVYQTSFHFVIHYGWDNHVLGARFIELFSRFVRYGIRAASIIFSSHQIYSKPNRPVPVTTNQNSGYEAFIHGSGLQGLVIFWWCLLRQCFTQFSAFGASAAPGTSAVTRER